MKPRGLLFLVAILVVALSGCDSMSKAWKGDSGGSADQKTANSAPTPTATNGDSADSADHNAVTEGEDDASRERRMKARSSLGLK